LRKSLNALLHLLIVVEEFSGVGDQFAVSWMINGLDTRNLGPQLRRMLFDMLHNDAPQAILISDQDHNSTGESFAFYSISLGARGRDAHRHGRCQWPHLCVELRKCVANSGGWSGSPVEAAASPT
jgi:hypothetical protein